MFKIISSFGSAEHLTRAKLHDDGDGGGGRVARTLPTCVKEISAG
jgi:hypothetical protein